MVYELEADSQTIPHGLVPSERGGVLNIGTVSPWISPEGMGSKTWPGNNAYPAFSDAAPYEGHNIKGLLLFPIVM